MVKKRGPPGMSNRLLYTLIAIGILAVAATGVYAWNTNNPSNFGHSLGEIETCSGDGKILKMSGGSWTCADDATGSAGLSGSGAATRVAFWDGASSLSSDSNLYWDDANNRLGIGTSSPTQKLEVNGSARLTDVYTDTMNTLTAGDTLEINYRSTSPTQICATQNCATVSAFFGTDGKVGIGTIAPSSALGVEGSITASGVVNSAGYLKAGKPLVYSSGCTTYKNRDNNPGYDGEWVEMWCGNTNTALDSSCITFVTNFNQNDNDPDQIRQLYCGVSGQRLYIHTDTTGNDDSENIGSGSVCSAICAGYVDVATSPPTTTDVGGSSTTCGVEGNQFLCAY